MGPFTSPSRLLLTPLLLVILGCSPGCTTTPGETAPTRPLEPRKTDAETTFLPVGGSADRIAYVIDRSASMGQALEPVKAELKRSLRLLKPNQRFYVVFYSSGPAVELPARKMAPALEANKLSAYEFIDSIEPAGQTNPNEAIQKAFAATPTTVYLLTDGEFKRAVIDLIDQLNPKREVIVNTFCVVYNSGEQIMREIANRNGGTYTHITRTDLKEN